MDKPCERECAVDRFLVENHRCPHCGDRRHRIFQSKDLSCTGEYVKEWEDDRTPVPHWVLVDENISSSIGATIVDLRAKYSDRKLHRLKVDKMSDGFKAVSVYKYVGNRKRNIAHVKDCEFHLYVNCNGCGKHIDETGVIKNYIFSGIKKEIKPISGPSCWAEAMRQHHLRCMEEWQRRYWVYVKEARLKSEKILSFENWYSWEQEEQWRKIVDELFTDHHVEPDEGTNRFQAFLAQHELVFAYFYSDEVNECVWEAPVLEELAKKHQNIVSTRVNVDSEKATAYAYKITYAPTMILFKNSKEIRRFTGFHTYKKLEKKVVTALTQVHC